MKEMIIGAAKTSAKRKDSVEVDLGVVKVETTGGGTVTIRNGRVDLSTVEFGDGDDFAGFVDKRNEAGERTKASRRSIVEEVERVKIREEKS